MSDGVEENAKSMEEIHGHAAVAAPGGRKRVYNCLYVTGKRCMSAG
jgi:hypothetical protein